MPLWCVVVVVKVVIFVVAVAFLAVGVMSELNFSLLPEFVFCPLVFLRLSLKEGGCPVAAWTNSGYVHNVVNV